MAPAPVTPPPPTVAPTPSATAPLRDALPAGFEVLDPTGRHAKQARHVRRLLPVVLAYLEERTGKKLEPPLKVVISTIREGDRCAVRGLALPGARQVYLYVGSDTPMSQIETALAHELAHVLQEQVAGGSVESVTLAEGFATYAEGRYWPLWDELTGFQETVRELRQDGRYIPLTRGSLPCDTDTRDRIYTERAAFVEWLIETCGWERFWRLNRISAEPQGGHAEPEEDLPFIEPPVLRRNPSYENAPWARVYGKSLVALEQEWLASLSD